MSDGITKLLGAVFIAVLAIVLIAVVLGLPVMLLWNWLMLVIFGLPTITFLQAIGLNVLSGILFRTSVNTKK